MSRPLERPLIPLARALGKVVHRHMDELTQLSGYDLVQVCSKGTHVELHFESDGYTRTIMSISLVDEVEYDRQERNAS
jgi:hypothetical protein